MADVLSDAEAFGSPQGQVLSDQEAFGAPQQPAPVSPQPTQQPDVLNDAQAFGQPEQSLGQKVASYIPEPVKEAGSMVMKALRPLAYPLNAETAALLEAGNLLGIPGAKELKQQLNPEGKILPDAFPSDISDFYIDKASKAMGGDQASTAMKMTLGAMKFGVGMGINILADPLSLVGIGEYTDAAKAIQKAGGKVLPIAEVTQDGLKYAVDKSALATEGTERNLLTIRAPFSDAKLDIRGKPVQDALSILGNNPIVNGIAKGIRALSPDTGNLEQDVAGRTYDSLRRGDPIDLNNRYGKLKDALNMSSDEDRVATALIEKTANLAPNIPDNVLSAAKVTWADAPTIERQMHILVEDTAKKMGVELAPGREDAIVKAGMLAKQGAAENLEDKFNAGVLTKDNIAGKVLENYAPRVMDPNYKDLGPKGFGSWASSKDPTRLRAVTRGMSLDEANQVMEKSTGVKDFFITDPVKAQQARLIESKKLLRDSEYLDKISSWGQRMKPSDAREAGLVPIIHPELEGKTVVLKDPDGSVQTVRHQDMVFPPELASKVQNRIAPPALTGLKATISNYNRIFRGMIFMSSPGIRFGNAMDNVLKTAALTGGNFFQATKDAIDVLKGDSAGFRSAPTALNPNGVFYDGKTLKSIVDRFGLTSTGAWSEGMEPFLQAGKQMSFQQAMQSPGKLLPQKTWQMAQDLVKKVDTFGAHGENTAKVALFLQKLREGYTPEMANSEVTKWLFDYTRNSPTMEGVRMVMPFMQHPMKSLMISHELLGTAPGTYNFIQNSFPHVVANAFHDPVTQTALNAVMPDSMKQRDAIAGPFIPGNTWIAKVFGSAQPGQLGSMAWFDPRIGLRILNHFNYFDSFASQRLFGEMSPLLQGMLGAAMGRDFSAKQGTPWASLDYANGAQNVAKRFNYMLSKTIGGMVPFPNAERILLQQAGIGDPKYIEPTSVLMTKGLAGQFVGVTNLDRDVASKLITLGYAIKDQEHQFAQTVSQEMKAEKNAGPVARYLNQKYGQIQGMSPAQVFAQANQSQEQMGRAGAAAQYLGGGMTAGDFIARIKGMHEAIHQINTAYSALGARMIQMGQGK